MKKLYIIVRTDMASMTAGRTAAQAAHAANYFVHYAKLLIDFLEDEEDQFTRNFYEWERQTDQGYGTTIVLDGGTEEQISNLIESLDGQFFTGIVIDPEYTLVDGNFVHIIPNVMTCAFAFAYEDEFNERLKGLNLYG